MRKGIYVCSLTVLLLLIYTEQAIAAPAVNENQIVQQPSGEKIKIFSKRSNRMNCVFLKFLV